MLRVAHLVLVCCPRQQTGEDMEVTMTGLWALVVRVQQLFSQSPQRSDLDWSPAALQALLQAWTRASEGLLACFDDVLDIPEFLSVSIQEMINHVDFFTWALRSGDSGELPRLVAYLQGRATHIAQVMSSLQDSTAPALKHQGEAGVEKSKSGTSSPPRDNLSCPLIPDIHPQRRDSPPPATSKLILAAESQSHQVVTSANTNLQEQDAAVDGPQEALAGEGPLGSERMLGLQEIPTLARSVIDLAREIAHCTTARSDGLLEVTLQLSGRPRETGQGLVARAGDWYPLCQQLFCHNPAVDLPGNMAAFMELQQDLASVVQLAAKSGPVDWDKQDPASTGHPEALLQMQGRLEEVETHSKQLLDKILAAEGLQAPESWEESIEGGCLLWSVAVQGLLQCMKGLSRKQSLFLLPLQQAVKDQQGLQEGLAQVADGSQRLQEAARLSSLLCGDVRVKGEVSFLCREIHVLTDALLDVAEILASSPKPSPSLSTRFELLCLELSFRAKALTGHLSVINADYERAFQDAFCPRLPVRKGPQTRPESSLERMVSGIQAAQGIVAGSQESGPCQKDLFMALESILVLTKEVAQRVPVLQEHPEEWRTHTLDWLQWEWAAKAHHAMAQLQAWKGGHTKAWRLLAQCLKPSEETAVMKSRDEQNPARTRAQLHCEEHASEAAAGSSVDSQGAAPQNSPGSSVGTCAAGPAIFGTIAADLDTVGQSASLLLPHHSPLPSNQRPLPSSRKSCLGAHMCNSHLAGSTEVVPLAVTDSTPPVGEVALCHLDLCDVTSLPRSRFFCRQMEQPGSPTSSSPGPLAWLGPEPDQRLPEDGGADRGSRIIQMTREMATEVLLMAQSLRRGGRILTKDQLITSARNIATSGQNFARFIRIIAKNCVDQRCSQELLSVVEQIQTMSNQLRIISSVKASLARSRSSEELLLENARQLLRAVSKTVRTTEAASLRGLRQPSSDPEELEVAAFCVQWRRKLRHRLRETSNLDCDELGLRKTSTKGPPTLAALVEEAL
ncbi:uncharacterized protein LOC117801786 [Ailuropoda melanoleuca]|uniref:uncharacterized protein LOC117801786 n=1 Tax=Ailuropoda melanoleuca TaxID=9646 RepID=UPI0014949BB2|nr:uncharacterized protein LOC117801786 [Ailuropoda melanoleuca]